MENFLNSLTAYSNLILIILNLLLVIITGVYAYLTRRMVLEMKIARENQTDANLVATPISADRVYAEIQLVNAGPGAALDVELSISLEPLMETVVKTWYSPSFLVSQKENFLLPRLDSLHELANKHNSVMVKIKWKNIFGKSKSFSASYNLNNLAQGWYNAGHLIPPDDIPTQMEKITKSLDEIHKDIEKISRDIHSQQNAENLNQINNKKPKTSRKKKATK